MTGFAAPPAPRVCSLAARVLLFFWDDAAADSPPKLQINCAGTDVPAPVHRLSAPLQGGGVRLFVAFAAPSDRAGPIAVSGPDGALFSMDAPRGEPRPAEHGFLDPATLLSGLTETGRVRLVRFLLHACRTAFGTGSDAYYAGAMRRLIEEISLRPGKIEARALLNQHHVLAAGNLPAALGDNVVALTVCDEGVLESLLPPSVGPRGSAGRDGHSLYLAVGRALLSRDVRIVIVGSAGIAIRRLAVPAASLEPVVTWLGTRGRKAAAGARDYALESLTALGTADEVAAHAAQEIIVLALPDGIAFKPDCAIAAGEHLFLSGVLSDPHRLIAAVDLRVGNWSATLDRDAVATVRAGADPGPAERFLALAAGRNRVPISGVARVALQLRSGAVVEVGTLPLAANREEAPDRILRAVAVGHATDSIVEGIVAPALRALAASPAPFCPAPDILEIGTPTSASQFSLILPFSVDLGIFTAWAAGLGAQVWDTAKAELIFVQPPALPSAEAERALVAFHRRFRRPVRLVRNAGNGVSDTFGLGAQAARSERLVFLGGACLPRERNAIETLISVLATDPACGVAGGAVLDTSGAIHHAGFSAPEDGDLRSRLAGFPAPALSREAAGPVFACSTAFLGVNRAVFEGLGGFAPGYCTRDWADADFCLRARAAGHAVMFVPQATATGYGNDRDPRKRASSVASRADGWRFLREWETEVIQWRDEAPAAGGSEAEQREAASSGVAVDPRWAA